MGNTSGAIPTLSILVSNMELSVKHVFQMASAVNPPVDIRMWSSPAKAMVFYKYFTDVSEFFRVWYKPIKYADGKVVKVKMNFPYECSTLGKSCKRYMFEPQKERENQRG